MPTRRRSPSPNGTRAEAASIAEAEAFPLRRRVDRAAAAVHPGVVLPMTRTVRIEVPPRIPARSSDIERLLRIAAARGASALFLTSESRPHMRVEGDIRQLENEAVLTRSDVEAAIVEIAPETARQTNGHGRGHRVAQGISGARPHSLHHVHRSSRPRPDAADDRDPRRHRGATGPVARSAGARHRTSGPGARRRPARERQVHADVGTRRSRQPAARRVRDHAGTADSPGPRQQGGARQPARNSRRRGRSAGGGTRRRCARDRTCWWSTI